jgi:hypothetical protein
MSLWRGPPYRPLKTIPNNRYVTHLPAPMKRDTIYGKGNVKSLDQHINQVTIVDEDSPIAY